jgi:uncharacterized membrane protein HdeD (DUF308 family)
MTSPANGSPGQLPGLPVGVLRIHRGELVAVAVIGIVLGVIGLFWPGVTLLTVAIIFGSYLIASGIFRITTALVADRLSTGLRWLTGLMGLIIIVAGIICLANPFGSLVVLAFVIGIGWVAEGVVDIIAAVRGTGTPRWLGWASGIVSIIAGIVTFVLPALALATFVTIGSILLIAVSVSSLLTLPRSRKAAAAR